MIGLEDAHRLIPEILEGQLAELARVSDEELGEACYDLCRFYRVGAIGSLLVEYDAVAFHHMLTRSATTRARYLERARNRDLPTDRYSKISRTDALFDAFAANRPDLAHRIAELTTTEWIPRYEYEDDYWYAVFFTRIALRSPEPELGRVLESLEASLNGADPRRFAVCKALFDREQEEFDAAFDALLERREEEIAEMERSSGRHDFEFAGARNVFVEGLAVLNIADDRGLKTELAYAYCPMEARMKCAEPFTGDLLPVL